MDAFILIRPFLDDLPRSIGRIVVDDKRLPLGPVFEDLRRPSRAGPLIDVRLKGALGRYAEGEVPRCRRILQRACDQLGLDGSHELSVVLCDARTIRGLNRKWRGKDRATNVLSFALHELATGEAPPEVAG